jgi:hypothetical protein
VIRHEERVDGDAVADVVTATQPFALEAERLVQLNGRLVPREDMELDLRDGRSSRPIHRGGEQRATNSPPAVARRDHEPEVGDVGARRVRVARERDATDDPVGVGVDGDEDGGVGVATDGAKVSPLVGDATPRIGSEQPVARLPADRGGEGDQLRRVAGFRVPDRDHETTTP